MLLKEFVTENQNVRHWSIYNHKGEQIAMTYGDILLELCDSEKCFKKAVDDVCFKSDDFVRIQLSSRRC